MFVTQGHVQPLSEHLADILLAVLAAYREQPAGRVLGAHEFLQDLPRGVEANATRTVLAAYTAPKRLIAIEHHDFVGRAPQRMEAPGNHRGQRGEKHWSIGNAA